MRDVIAVGRHEEFYSRVGRPEPNRKQREPVVPVSGCRDVRNGLRHRIKAVDVTPTPGRQLQLEADFSAGAAAGADPSLAHQVDRHEPEPVNPRVDLCGELTDAPWSEKTADAVCRGGGAFGRGGRD